MFLNFSNYPKTRWPSEQLEAAQKYGEIMELAFPRVPANTDAGQIRELADKYMEKIMSRIGVEDTVMIQGEFTLTYAVAKRLREKGIRVVSACSERQLVEKTDGNGNTVKESRFQFIRFREYE